MIEADWLASDDPTRMLRWLSRTASPPSGRKLRLMAVAMIRRRHAYSFGDATIIRVAALAEEVADGLPLPRDRPRPPLLPPLRPPFPQRRRRRGDFSALLRDAKAAARRMVSGTDEPAFVATIREIVGNPFCPPVCRPPSLRDRDGGVIRQVALAAYENRSMPSGDLEHARLAVLADALEEAGGFEGAILAHLRSPGPHVRGCWALDLILGRE